MLWIIQFVIAFGFISETLAAFGDLRISGGGSDGKLEFQDRDGVWGAVCINGFDDDAGDVACTQLGYVRSSDVYTYESDPASGSISICSTNCNGDEDELIDCFLLARSICNCNGAVGITCTHGLSAGVIVGMVIGLLVFAGVISTFIIVLIYCVNRGQRSGTATVTHQPAANYSDPGFQPCANHNFCSLDL